MLYLPPPPSSTPLTWIIFSRNSGGKPARLRVTFGYLGNFPTRRGKEKGWNSGKTAGQGGVGRGGRTGKSVSPAEVNASRVEAPVKLNCKRTLFLFLARANTLLYLASSLSVFVSPPSPSLSSAWLLYLNSPHRQADLSFPLSSFSIHPVSPSSVCAVDSCLHLFH